MLSKLISSRKAIGFSALFLASTLSIWFLAAKKEQPKPTAAKPNPKQMFAGLPPMKPTGREVFFNFRPGPKPPGNIGKHIKLPFPPPKQVAAQFKPKLPKAGPLKVLRYRPTGKVGLIGAVTVTFSQPMVPLGSIKKILKQKIPFTIKPKPKGRFRWLGTRTVSFEPKGRMPYSTRYRVKIRKGLRSLRGGVLAKAIKFSFTTPRLKWVSTHPYNNQTTNLDVPIALHFNQDVKEDTIFRGIRMSTSWNKVTLKLIRRSTWKQNKKIWPIVRSWNLKRTVVLKPTKRLKKNRTYTIALAQGTKGAEGPFGAKRSVFYFKTYGPLKVKDIYCTSYVYRSWGRRDKRFCYPHSGIYVTFTNSLKKQSFDKTIQFSPKFNKRRVSHWGSTLRLFNSGGLKPSSKYRVYVNKGIKDIYGQVLKIPKSATIRVREASRYMNVPRNGISGLETNASHTIPVQMRNITRLRERIARVPIKELSRFYRLAVNAQSYKYRNKPFPSFKTLRDRYVSTGAKKNKRHTYKVELDKLTSGRPGMYFVLLTSKQLIRKQRWGSPHRAMLVQVTDIGLTARYGPRRIITMVTGLSSGQPLSKTPLALYNVKSMQKLWSGQTNAQGLAVLPGRHRLKVRGPYFLVAKGKKDKAVLIIDRGKGGRTGYLSLYSHWGRKYPKFQRRHHIFTDKSPYKPGETVHLRGVFRRLEQTPLGGVGYFEKRETTLHYTITSPRWQVLKKGKVKLDKDGAFQINYKLKPLADLGNYRFRGYVKLKKRYQKHHFYNSFTVQAYRTPEYKVNVRFPKGPHFLKDKVTAKIEGRYFFGAPMIGAKVRWSLRRKAGSYRPPNQPSGFTFGIPSWGPYGGWRSRYGYRGGRYRRYYRHYSYTGKRLKSGVGRLNSKGFLAVQAHLKPGKLKGVGTYTLEAQVYDKNRQSIAGRKTVIGHRSGVYVGLHPTKYMIKAGTASKVEYIAVNVDGNRIKGQKITISAYQRVTTRKLVKKKGSWTYKYTTKDNVSASCQAVSDKTIRSCLLTLKKPGSYKIRAETTDSKGRKSTTLSNIYVYGPGYVPWKTNNAERIELITDKKSYKPGDTARILIKSPFRKARGILTIERNGIAEHHPLVLKGSAQAIQLKIRSEYVPNLYVSVALVRGRVPSSQLGVSGKDAEDLGRPAFAFGQSPLKVALTEKDIRVKIAVKPGKTIRPGSKLQLKINTSDYKGRPVRSTLTIALVDEGVLSLLGFRTPNSLKHFHINRPAWAALKDLRRTLLKRKKKKKIARNVRVNKQRIVLQSKRSFRFSSAKVSGTVTAADETAATPPPSPSPGGRARRSRRLDASKREEAKAGERSRKGATRGPRAIRVRSKFVASAYYRGVLRTNAKGEASVSIKMPDNLTTFRIMVVAMDQDKADRFGSGEDRVTIRKPLLLRPALPRFANFGDHFEAGVVVNNETGKSGLIHIFARGINIQFTGKQQKSIQIPAGEAREVRFKVKVAKTGIARFQFAAALGQERDAVEKSIPILLPATAEAFATYGTTHSSVAQPVIPPKNALPQFGGMKISLSSTALNGLEDAVRYLVEYPFECNEQTASRAMPIFALNKILPEFKIGQVSDLNKMKLFATNAITKLVKAQRYDGGWGYWSGSRRSWMWISGYVTYALLKAKDAGYKIPKRTMRKAIYFLRNRLRNPHRWERYNYSAQVMALWVLTKMNQFMPSQSTRLYKLRKKLPMFAKAWLMVAMHRKNPADSRIKEILRILKNSVNETPSSAHFSEAKTESLRMLMHSEDRSDGIILDALLEVRPKLALIPKVARGLMKSRIRGRWSTTQANAYAMLAMAHYYKVYEKVVPNFTIQNWLGNGYLGQTKFKGRSMTVVDQHVPMGFLKKQKNKTLILAKKGKGRVYYRIGLRYAPKSLKLPPAEQGFAVKRTYEPVDGKDTVVRKKGHWQIKAGSYVRVRLQVVVPGRRFYAAVVDPLPAGLEAVNLSFKTSASSRLRNKLNNIYYDSHSWYSRFAFNHKEKRDSMVVMFANRLPAGVYEYTYLARATTIGSFIAPPTRAEEMYEPEVFGRAATDFVRVITKK